MSADNYLYVRKLRDIELLRQPKGVWTVTMEQGEEVREVRDDDPRFTTWVEAYKAAQAMEQEKGYCEYGIYSDPAE